MELVNRNQSLEIPQPKTQLDRMESWGTLSDEDRKRRAAEALLHGVRESLSGLLESYLCIFGRKGLRVSENTLTSYTKGLEEILDFSETNGIKAHQFTRQHALRFARHLEARKTGPVFKRLGSFRY